MISHHGRWGKIQPSTKEACIVYKGDMYSAKYHRINPIGADSILAYIDKGYSLEELSKAKLHAWSHQRSFKTFSE
ncbi:Uncharacterised protein [Fusobacterium necrophorum subsp. necrophorum]|nr:Uncharacterised protein [Fusobacterium necrophorum subsp. necrophorum]